MIRSGLEDRLLKYATHKRALFWRSRPAASLKPGARRSVWRTLTGSSDRTLERMKNSTEQMIAKDIKAVKNSRGNVTFQKNDNGTWQDVERKDIADILAKGNTRRTFAKGVGTGAGAILGLAHGGPAAVNTVKHLASGSDTTKSDEKRKGGYAVPITLGVLGLGAAGLGLLSGRKPQEH